MKTATPLLARAATLLPIGPSRLPAARGGQDDFSARVLDALDIGMDIRDEDVRRIPVRGPLLVVANHPSGATDGLLLLTLMGRVRRDVRVLGNDLLRVLPGLRPSLLPVAVFGRGDSARRNAATLRRARRWLEQGGCLVIFPAGEVAHALSDEGSSVDSPWRPSAAWLAARTEAAVLPVHIAGHTSALFRAAGRLHPMLRTLLLPAEMWAKRRSTVAVRVGAPVPPSTLARLADLQTRTAFLRASVEAVAGQPGRDTAPPETGSAHAPVAIRGRLEHIEADVLALEPEALIESGRYQVFCAPSRALPALLPEIGRLREIAFRQTGEGTGLPRDLDRFDDTYQHLFVWDRGRREVAGAYRLGATDVVAAGGRVEGLYTRTLFVYDARLVDQIGPALELGRSFVQPDYQRDFSPLLLLWKGISQVVAASRRYRRLFGVVSVSDRYQSLSRQLLVRFLQTRRFDADLGRLVRANNAPRLSRHDIDRGALSSFDEVSALIRRIEPDGKDVPVLLRQYLKLNATFLGFTVDAGFANVLDGLVLVDLDQVEPALLARYMGRQESRSFLAERPLRRAG